jgi:hypothetical protein
MSDVPDVESRTQLGTGTDADPYILREDGCVIVPELFTDRDTTFWVSYRQGYMRQVTVDGTKVSGSITNCRIYIRVEDLSASRRFTASWLIP